MAEIKSSDVTELKNPETENYKSIKPEGNITKSESGDFWNDKFNQDDNGNEYRDANDLKPNATYELNGYTYKTDDQGRITTAEGKLQIKDHQGYKKINSHDNMEVVGKGNQKENDDRGHLIADRFNGKGDLGNLVPMDQELNRGDYVSLEDKLAKYVKDGADVRVKVEPIYFDDSKRPSEIKVSYTIDGEKDIVVFKNGGNN